MTADEPTRDDLDRILQTWSAARAADSGHVHDLRERILTAAVRDVDQPIGGVASMLTRRCTRSATSLCMASAVASLLLATMTFWFSSRTTGPREPDLPEWAWLRADVLQDRVVMVERMTSSYGCQIRWLAETNHQLEIGLDDASTSPSTDDPLAVRFVVERRRPGETGWTAVQTLDVISRGQEVVELPTTLDGVALRLWAYRLPDGLIYVDSDVSLSGDVSLRSTTTQLLEAGRPRKVFTSRKQGTEFRIYQSAAELPLPS